MTPALHKIWCDEDEHYRYEHFADFNEWLDSEGQAARIDYGVDALPQPNKALFAGTETAMTKRSRRFAKPVVTRRWASPGFRSSWAMTIGSSAMWITSFS